jgi:AcrR family transcriptional regulator
VPKEKRREQLIKATIKCVARSGLVGTTMADVTQQAGLSIGIVNLHFQSKEKLLIETLRYVAEEYRLTWKKALADALPDVLIDLDFIKDNLATVVSVVVFITVFKTALNVTVLGLLGETWPRAFQTGVLLAQIGEFSFVLVALGLSVGSVSPETYRLIVAVTALSLMISPFWLLTARRLHRIALTGVTSPRELLRLTFGREAAVVFRTTRLAEHRMIDMAGGATRWVGDIMPRRNRPPDEPGPDVPPGLGPPMPDGRKRDRS